MRFTKRDIILMTGYTGVIIFYGVSSFANMIANGKSSLSMPNVGTRVVWSQRSVGLV